MTTEFVPRSARASLPLSARFADRTAGWLQSWRSWLGVAALFVVLFIPVLTVLRAHWVAPQPPLAFVLAFAIGLTWALHAFRVNGWLVHLICLAVGAGLTWWLGIASSVAPEFRIFIAFLVAAVWLAGYLSAWSVLRLRNAWPGVVTGALVLIINLNNLPGAGGGWFVLFFIAAALFIFEVRLTRNTAATLVSETGQRRGWYRLGALLAALLVVAVTLALALPQPRAPGFQTYVATNVMFRLNLEASDLNIFDVVPSRQVANTISSQGDLNFGTLWHEQDNIDFIVRSPVASYWRVRIYDTYTEEGWSNSPMEAFLLEKGTVWTGEAPPAAQGHLLAYEVTTAIRTDLMLTAGTLVTADTPYVIHTAGNDLLAANTPRVLEPDERYIVTTAYYTPTTADLAAVPSGYPAEIGAAYLGLPDDLPREIRDLAAEVIAGATTPYQKVAAIDAYLSTYKYDTRIDAPPEGADGVAYFLFTEKAGFCTYFASAMAVMLRTVDVPTRLVVGYLPGELGSQPGEYILRDKHYHAWPQAYFEGYGWVDLEATPSSSEGTGSGSQVTLPEPWVASPEAHPGASLEDLVPFTDFDGFFPIAPIEPDSTASPPRTGPQLRLPFAEELGKVVLVLIVLGLALLVLMIPVTFIRNGFGRWLWHVDRATVAVETFQKMGRLAALARLGPDASQTPFEYATALATAMPERAGDVSKITQAYVNARFGRAAPPGLFEEAEILKARYQVYAALLERVGFVRRMFRRRRD